MVVLEKLKENVRNKIPDVIINMDVLGVVAEETLKLNISDIVELLEKKLRDKYEEQISELVEENENLREMLKNNGIFEDMDDIGVENMWDLRADELEWMKEW